MPNAVRFPVKLEPSQSRGAAFDLVLDWIATRRLPAGNDELVVASGAADLPGPASTGAPDV